MAGAVNNSFVQEACCQGPGRVPGKVCLPPSKHLAACSSNVPPICDPHQIKVGSAAGWQTCPRPRPELQFGRGGVETAGSLPGASLPGGVSDPWLCSRLSQPDTGHRDAQAPEPGGASGAAPFFSMLPNLKAAVVHAGRTIDGGLEWPQPRLFLMLSMLGSTPAGPGQVMDQRRMP